MNKNNFKCKMKMLRALWKIYSNVSSFLLLSKGDKINKMNFKVYF